MKHCQTTDKSRRNFWKNLGLTWARGVKKAQQDANYPDVFQGVNYKITGDNHGLLKGAALPPFPLLTLKNGTVFNLKSVPEKKSVFPAFFAAFSLNCVFHGGDIRDFADTTAIVYHPDLTNLQASAPRLLLFENDAAASIVHRLPAALGKLPAGSDVYIGNILKDLSHEGPSPTKERLEMFLAEIL